jgi:hypothetical protein
MFIKQFVVIIARLLMSSKVTRALTRAKHKNARYTEGPILPSVGIGEEYKAVVEE